MCRNSLLSTKMSYICEINGKFWMKFNKLTVLFITALYKNTFFGQILYDYDAYVSSNCYLFCFQILPKSILQLVDLFAV